MTAVFLVCGLLVLVAAEAPEKLVFESKMGKVTFLHAKHAERAKATARLP
jgi:hypothetical protein